MTVLLFNTTDMHSYSTIDQWRSTSLTDNLPQGSQGRGDGPKAGMSGAGEKQTP